MTTQSDFRNRLAILRSIDLHELQAVGLFDAAWDADNTWRGWVWFRTDPYQFFLSCSDVDADRIWQAIERRAVAHA